MTFDHLVNHKEEATEDSLKKIVELAEAYKERKAELELAEAQAKQAKKAFNKVSQELIPEAMQQAGVSSFELTTGEKVAYKEELSASVKDYDRLVGFLSERGDDGIVKVSIEIGKVPQNILNKVIRDLSDKYGILADVKLFVHPMTLKSYFSEICGIKKNSVAEMSVSDIDSQMVGIYTYFKTTIK